MKPFIQLIAISLLFSNCYHNTEKDDLLVELQGDWVGSEDEAIMMIDQNRIVENQPWAIKYFEPFRIQEGEIIIDSIRIRKKKEIKKYEYDVRYRITYMANDTLELIKYSVGDTITKQALRLERLNPLYQYEFEKLSISSSPCFGYCPAFQLEIDAAGKVKFQGEHYTDKSGNYKGQIGKADLQLIKNQIDKIDWEGLKDGYWTQETDIQYFNIEMETRNGKKYTVSTDSPKSKSINILIFRAFKIIEDSELDKVDEPLEFSTDVKYDMVD